ncbi:hypothetical protein ACEUAY_00365 [Aeromonas veronii]|uniref:hypothetical protein n=1 Tax=Aeromonas TaxID=642 RepID=UPI0011191E42|nr:hypothetical protein [Aeromonas veronii]TNI15162.1 hypothetical protein CF106_02255 [Aeromonas veronii]
MPVPAKPFWLSAAYAEFGGNRWMSDTANRAGIPAPRWLGDLAGRSAWTWNATPSTSMAATYPPGSTSGTATAIVWIRSLNGLTGMNASGASEVYISPSGPVQVHATFVSGNAMSGTFGQWITPGTTASTWSLSTPKVGNAYYTAVVDFTFRSQANNAISRVQRVNFTAEVSNEM